MKLNDAVEAKFNEQITMEFQSALAYRQLAIAADERDLVGMAAWLRQQAIEEVEHAQKFIDHVVDRGNHAEIGALKAPGLERDLTPQQIFQSALEHEQLVSQSVRDLYRACDEAGDLESRPLLHWFLSEQIEEEATVNEVLGRLRLTGDDGAGLLRIDSELSRRHALATESN